MLELVKICQEKEFLCIHDDIDDLIKSALDSKLLLINSNSQRLEKKQQKVKNVVEQPAERENRSIQSLQNIKVVHKSSISFDTSQISSIHSIALILSTKEPEHLLSMGYEHLSITPKTESNEVTEFNAENLLPILSECEVALEDKRECDVPISKNFPVCDNHSYIVSDSKIDDDISVYDDDFENIEYVEASLSDPEIVSIEVQQEEEEVDFEDISQIQYVVLERLINLVKNDISDSSNDPLLEEVDLFLSNNSILPGIENFANDPERDIRFLEELLIDNSILSHESFDSNFKDNPSIPRPPPKPPDVETDTGEEIPVVMNDTDEYVDYSSFIFVNYLEIFPLLLSAESEDTIFDPEEVDLFLSNNSILPGIENFANDLERDIRFLEELLIDNSILSHESFDSNFEDNPSIPRPPPKPPDVETNTGEEIPVVMNDTDEDVDYSSFIFVNYLEIFPLLLSAQSEDTIFDPDNLAPIAETLTAALTESFVLSARVVETKTRF
nr:hypothetical protein [Tanacetum cinerariifolium]